ncbi:MAG TPA: metalloregulator ArsR/SmtB family transcription factor [Acetobacteraceae bacterium]|nr:metalloregulator ArsR/SmtB family transcription factor [Acetobacteraceae bacterium]
MDRIDCIFKALGDPARLRILAALARPDAACCSNEDQVCACDLEPLLGLAQPTVSHHMKLLTDAGLVQARKSGRWVYYRLDRDRFHALAAWLTDLAGDGCDAPAAVAPVLALADPT